MKASQAFGILSVLAIAGAGCCLGLVMMTKKGILLFGAIAGTVMSCKNNRMYLFSNGGIAVELYRISENESIF